MKSQRKPRPATRHRFPIETAGSKENRRFEAQGLVYKAMDALTLDSALKLARRAVELYPACLDAPPCLPKQRAHHRRMK